MGSVYHEQALEVLMDIGASDCEPETVRATLNEKFPGWRGNAVPTQGYSSPHQHCSTVVARCLYDALPPPFNAVGYDVSQQHGFGPAMSYIDTPGRKPSEIATLFEAAADRCQVLMND